MDPTTAAIAINVTKELAPKIYDDGLQPAVREIGKGLGTLASTINVALAPINWMVYGFEIIDKQVKLALQEKLSNILPEKISTPDASIVVPAYEALRCSLDKETLKEMYINLIASSMIEDKKNSVHPAFVEIIKQLSSQDAKLLKDAFSNTKLQLPKVCLRLQISEGDATGVNLIKNLLPDKFYTNSYSHLDCQCSLDNLERLKLIEIVDGTVSFENLLIQRHEKYEDITVPEYFKVGFSNIYPHLHYLNIINGCIAITNFGERFLEVVL